MTTSPNTFDKLFNELVYEQNKTNFGPFEDILNIVGEDSVMKKDPILNSSYSLKTPDIEFPLPDINFPTDESEEKIPKLEAIIDPFDITTTFDNEGEVQDENDEDWTPQSKITLRKPNPRKRKMKAEVAEVSKAEPKRKRPKKLYEEKPFADPEKERNRLNAINAKINRDRKKKEKEALTSQMEILRKENEKLKKELRIKDRILEKHGLL